MNRSIRSVILGSVGLALLVLAGCENNEARVTGTGVTPPGAGASSEDGGKVKVPETSAPPAGYGGGMMKKPAAKPSAPAK
jgi:hypothetical protein